MDFIESLNVPNEILSRICWYLAVEPQVDHESLFPQVGQTFWNPGPDIFRLRLVCKRFADVGAQYSHYNVSVCVHPLQFARLEQVWRHPLLSRCVRSLTYDASMLPSRPRIPWPNFRHLHSVPGDHEARVLAKWEAYDALDCAQRPYLDEGQALVLRDAHRALPRLKTLTISCAPNWAGMRGCKLPWTLNDYSLVDGPVALAAHAKALPVEGSPLETLRLLQLPCDMLSWNADQVSSMLEPFSQLKHLEVSFQVSHQFQFNRFRDAADCGWFAAWLKPLARLETLEIDLRRVSTGTIRSVADLETLLTAQFYRPHLRRLVLRKVQCTAAALTAALLRHKNTLRELCLDLVLLRGGTWNEVFASVRDGMGSKLEAVHGASILSEKTDARTDTGVRVLRNWNVGARAASGLRLHRYCTRLQEYECALDPLESFSVDPEYERDIDQALADTAESRVAQQ